MNQKTAVKQLNTLKKLTPKTLRLAAEWPKKYQVLIATILSAQTKDETTIKISKILFKKYPSMKALSNAKQKTLEKIIRPVNYHKTKSKHIIATAKVLVGKKIPKTIEELIKLPGVGRKVANVYLAEAEKADTIGVDTHIKRISQKLGWTKNRHPHKIERDLEKIFPKKYWSSINYIVVMFGRTIGKNRRKEDEVLKKIRQSKNL